MNSRDKETEACLVCLKKMSKIVLLELKHPKRVVERKKEEVTNEIGRILK